MTRTDDYGDGQPKVAKFRLEWTLVDEEALEPPEGKVDATDKAVPVEEADNPRGEPYIFRRGQCDVSELAAKILHDDSIWSSSFARARNVEIVRPSHDAWGIRKLVFIFCDDFLSTVYRLPLWHDPEWRRLVEPAILASGIHPNQVVRCLLASMPPRTVIPTHHDSGYWVAKTHRLHCAVVTNDRVIFRVGPRADELQRFRLAPGTIVELNNQAKHYVANLSNQYRTHVIFDYVDGSVPPCVELQPGEKLFQTRRTIDRARDRGTGPPAPHFLIIGAQKAGTTSMYEYIAKHPLVIKGKRRETHFLDWRWVESDDPAALWHKTFYDVEAHHAHPSLVAGDSTPSYLLNSYRAIPRLQAMGKHCPLVVMLRNPVDRAASHFAMIADPNATPAQRRSRGTAWLGRDLASVAEDELRHLVDVGLLVPRSSGEPALTDAFDLDPARLDFVLSTLPNHGAHSLLLRGLYALQLKPWLEAFPRTAFAFVRCEDLGVDPRRTRAVVLDVQRHVGLKDHPLDLADAQIRHNVRDRDPLSADLRRTLAAFYRPFNHDLYALLGWPPERHWS